VADAIAAGRARIDELDAQIIALVEQRRQVSQGIQRVRIASGGRRLEHSREVDIVNRYAAAFDRAGADLALAILALSRGTELSRHGAA
jgi:chorismate mutase